jgi:hypothetical protein
MSRYSLLWAGWQLCGSTTTDAVVAPNNLHFTRIALPDFPTHFICTQRFLRQGAVHCISEACY